MAKMTALVTGGLGFIAATLIRRLVEAGQPVLAVDNFSRGNKANLGQLVVDPLVRIVKVDAADIVALRNAVAAEEDIGPITDVWHLAANSDIPAGIADPQVDLKDTFMTTFNVLKLMAEIGAKRMFFASSSAIYGDLGATILREDVGPLFPISNYGAMKLASEALITAAAETFLDRALLFRFPNVVGVPATHGVLLDFIRRLKADPKRLQVLGDGTQRKSYLHVSDLVNAMLFIEKGFAAKVGAVNIGPADDGVTVATIAEETIAHVAPGAILEYGNGNKGWVGDVPRFTYSTVKLHDLGWTPSMDSLAAVRLAIREIASQESSV